jgi:hypothetical protein
MYLFALDQTRSRAGAFVACLIFGFNPITLSDAGHVNMLITGWVPLALLYVDRVIRSPGWRNAALGGLFLALLGITRWQLLAVALIPGVIFLAQRLYRQRAQVTWRTFAFLTAQVVVAGTLMAPFWAPLVVAQLTRPHPDGLLLYEPAFSADLLSYFVPHMDLRLWQWFSAQLPANLQFHHQEIAFLGYTTLLLAACALFLRTKPSLPWLATALVLMILAMGPVVTIGQAAYEWIFTPYRLIEETLFNQFIRKPWRYDVLLNLPLAMLAAIGIAALRPRGRHLLSVVLVAGVAAVILAEYWMAPYPLIAADMTPPWYRQLAEDPEEFGIAGMPISSRFADKFYMYYQMEHGKPIIGGHVSRQPRESVEFIQASPWLNDMFVLREMDPALVDVTHQLRYLADANLRYVILHKHFVSGEKIEAWKQWLTFTPLYEDEFMVVYRTQPQAGIDFVIAHALTPQLGVIQAGNEPEDLPQGEPMSVDIRWGTTGAVRADYDYCVNLLAEGDMPLQQECVQISPLWPTSRWEADEVARSTHTFRVDPFLPQGEYGVRLSLRDRASGAQVGESMELDSVQVNAQTRQFAPPTPQQPTDAAFGDQIRLYGYDLATEEDLLQLKLYWGTEQRIDRTYKVFVHLVDAATSEMLAQYDAAPRNWAYPTTWWEAGEVIDETIELPLPSLDGRDIVLSVGLYDELTGERLELRGTAARGSDSADALQIKVK